jgi:hypothetical protein
MSYFCYLKPPEEFARLLMRFYTLLLFFSVLALLLDSTSLGDDVYQWSVPVIDGKDRRAYLWIPPGCQHVRGLVVGLNNMQEEHLFMNDDFRKNLADLNMGIVWIFPGFAITSKEAPNQPPLSGAWPNGEQGQKDLQQVLTDLAKESGYAEVENAPFLPIAHSAASPFVWRVSDWTDRVFAAIPLKGFYVGGPSQNVPFLDVSAEWAEVGGPNWGEAWQKDRLAVLKLRANKPHGQDVDQSLVGNVPDIGAGHYNCNPDLVPILNMFIRKAVAARLPDAAPGIGPVTLKSISIESGVLADPMKIGTPDFITAPYNDYAGDKRAAYWFFDQEMAKAVNDYVTPRLAKKPEMIDYVDENGQVASLEKGGVAGIHPKMMNDGIIKVQAVYLDKSPQANMYGGGDLGHSKVPIQFRVSSGGLKQVGPDTFRIWAYRGNLERQGQPWEPTILAWTPGDAEYRSADRPIHPWVPNTLIYGSEQTIDFPQIPNQPADAKSITLQATASSGLPVQFFVVSGPATMDDDNKKLLFTPIPAQARKPLRIRVGTYQWGHPEEPKFKTAPEVVQEFFLGGDPASDQLTPPASLTSPDSTNSVETPHQ